MAKRIETGIFDRLINAKLLGKRKLGLPTKHYYEVVQSRHGRMADILLFPKNRLEKMIGNIYERFMPGMKLLIWNEKVEFARDEGLTIGERMYHYFLHAPAVQMHAMAQTVHPFAYLDLQRRDACIRQTEVLMPGITVPEWANQLKRAHDFDFNSIKIPNNAMDMVLKESTPSPHHRKQLYFAANNMAIHSQHTFGRVGQRLHFNEDLRGDFYQNGYVSESDKKIIHGWYANSQTDSLKDRIDNLSESERAEYEHNVKRWKKNYAEFYPEYQNTIHNPILHKYDEAYYERNMADIRSSIFTSKWIQNISKFSSDEIQSIHEFFLNENTSVFFTQSNVDEEYKPTALWNKFAETLNFPDIFKIDRFIAHAPELQFLDILDKNWGINFNTVDNYRAHYIQLIKNNPDTEGTSLIKEEVYNSLFRHLLKEKYNYNVAQNESFVSKALQEGVSIKELNEIAQSARESVHITSYSVLENMINTQVRKVVKTFNFKAKL